MELIGFGVDIGGSGTKGARVNLETGELASDRIKFPTPKGYAIDDVVQTVLDVVEKGYRANGAVLRPARVVVSG